MQSAFALRQKVHFDRLKICYCRNLERHLAILGFYRRYIIVNMTEVLITVMHKQHKIFAEARGTKLLKILKSHHFSPWQNSSNLFSSRHDCAVLLISAISPHLYSVPLSFSVFFLFGLVSL